VLIPVIEKKDGLHILYQVRSDNLRRQPGEISFPGGKMEAGESSAQCAVRETHEELGIPMDSIKIMAKLNYLNSYSNFTMYSFLGSIDQAVIDEAQINKNEVKEIFTVPLDYLMAHEPFIYSYELKPQIHEDFPYEEYGIDSDYSWGSGFSQVPFYIYEDKVIWGMTGRLTLELVNLLRVIE
jgi:8-oxo-dGTP pyrophosphatase MutT (NUDIX family)